LVAKGCDMLRLRIWKALGLCAVALALPIATPAAAEVTQVSDQGFAVLHVVKINAAPDKVWATLTAPQSYWSSGHSWSGDAANMYLDPQAGGCFCEKIPAKSAEGGSLNSVEHMRVIYSERPRVLRMSGALGPLQSEGVIGTMNVAMEADGSGTKISMSYVVGGFMRMKPQDIAPAVDAVIGEQLLRLKARAEGRDPGGVTWPPRKDAAAKVDNAPEPATAKPNMSTPPKPVAEQAKDLAPPVPNAVPPKDAAAKTPTPTQNAPKPATAQPKPPLSERLKDPETPASGDAPTPVAKPVDPNLPPKKKPIVEEAPKKKPATVPPGTR
jgi:uncharacterized protein YndB with AHSA1/START domain